MEEWDCKNSPSCTTSIAAKDGTIRCGFLAGQAGFLLLGNLDGLLAVVFGFVLRRSDSEAGKSEDEDVLELHCGGWVLFSLLIRGKKKRKINKIKFVFKETDGPAV